MNNNSTNLERVQQMLGRLQEEGYGFYLQAPKNEPNSPINPLFFIVANGDKRMIVDGRKETTGEYNAPPIIIPYYDYQIQYDHKEDIHYIYLWLMLERRFITSLEQSTQLRIVRHYLSRDGYNLPESPEKITLLTMLNAELRRLTHALYNKSNS